MRLLALVAFLFVGCATPYQPVNWVGYGYTDQPFGSDTYLVKFQGNDSTSQSTAERYAARRANEVCNERGFDTFEIVSFNSGNNGSSAYINGQAFFFKNPTTSLLIRCIKPQISEPIPSH